MIIFENCNSVYTSLKWIMNYDINQSELLIFRAVVEPRNSAKSAKSHGIHKNAQNTAKFSRNLIKYMSVQHIWNLSQLLGLFTCRKLTNLSWNFVTEMYDQVVFCLFVFFGKGEKRTTRTFTSRVTSPPNEHISQHLYY